MRWRFSSFAQHELCSSLLAYIGDLCSLRLTHKITALSYVVPVKTGRGPAPACMCWGGRNH